MVSSDICPESVMLGACRSAGCQAVDLCRWRDATQLRAVPGDFKKSPGRISQGQCINCLSSSFVYMLSRATIIDQWAVLKSSWLVDLSNRRRVKGRAMATYLLTFSRKLWGSKADTPVGRILKKFKKGEQGWWSCGRRRKIQPGDRVFLMQLQCKIAEFLRQVRRFQVSNVVSIGSMAGGRRRFMSS